MAYDAIDAGKRIGEAINVAPNDERACQDICDGDPSCYSVRFCSKSGSCAKMDKVISEIDEMKDKSVCHTSYQTACDGVGKNIFSIYQAHDYYPT